jgi:anti-sigma regulatory factor (Ser/Thr protein kinase)
VSTVQYHAVEVLDATGVGEARRLAARIAEQAGFAAADSGRVALIATELAGNIARHARQGELFVGSGACAGCPTIDVIAIDRGPGMTDVERCLVDGYSTAGTPGTGLGAVRRLSDVFDMYSSSPGGTVVFARCTTGGERPAGRYAWGAVSLPAPREDANGDALAIAEQNGHLSILLADGLGHGPLAAEAAARTVDVFYRVPFTPPAEILRAAHLGAQGTRGAAAAVASVSTANRQVRYAGVGNIAAYLHARNGSGERRGMVSLAGTVGANVRRVQEFEYPFESAALLIMHSDGLQSRWNLNQHPELPARHPAVIAGVLYRDFGRGSDDVTVAVVRLLAGAP